MLRLLASASAFTLIMGAAHAADIPIYEPPPPAMVSPTPIAYNWSGFYIGAHGGYGFADGDFEDGFVIGGQAGFNWQWNTFVLGVEGDGSFVDFDDVDVLGTLRLRGGFALDRFLVYGTGGAAFGPDLGWVAGGGAEFALTDSVSLGAEYLHYEYDDGSADVVRGRLNVKFNSLFGG